MLNEPIVFCPYLKNVIWGGDRIARYKGDSPTDDNVGESWEISAVPGCESVVADGPLKGMSISALTEKFGADFLGSEVAAKCSGHFPLLIKLIDARADLSVQVHPDDYLAAARHKSPGKTEMWYIIETLPGAKIYSGFRGRLSPDEYDRRIADNSIMEVVGTYDSAPGQFYYVPAGTVHSIGAGNLLAEVQQTSDITYRIYDFDRRDAEGRTRELHTDLARNAIHFADDIAGPTAATFDATTEGVVECPYFRTDFLHLHPGESFAVDTRRRSFAIVMVIDGGLRIQRSTDGREFSFSRGSTVLIPAAMPPCSLIGSAKALYITIP